jgi:hypothetical protein
VKSVNGHWYPDAHIKELEEREREGQEEREREREGRVGEGGGREE